MTRHVASEKARANWRELLDAVEDGETIVIQRYGRPVATLAAYHESAPDAGSMREPAPVYEAAAIARLKEEIVADVLAQIEARQMEPVSWNEGLDLLRKQIADSGGLGFGDDPEAIVEQMRRTRQEIWDAEYAHLYR